MQLHDFRYFRRFLTHDASVLVANALVSSRLDYCNSLFRSLSKFSLHKLQFIQKSAARIISNTSRCAGITPVLKKLHWLPLNMLFTRFFILVFPSILIHISLPTVPGAVRVVVISLWFQRSTLYP